MKFNFENLSYLTVQNDFYAIWNCMVKGSFTEITYNIWWLWWRVKERSSSNLNQVNQAWSL